MPKRKQPSNGAPGKRKPPTPNANKAESAGSQKAGRSNALTGKQAAFVDAYIANRFNATAAARDAGYSGTDGVLAVVGHDNLKNPKVSDVIAARMRELTLSAEQVLVSLGEHATASLEDFMDIVDIAGHPVAARLDLAKAKSNGKLHLLKKITFHEVGGGVKSIELHDAQSALRDLGRYHKLFIDRVDVTSLGKKMKGYVGISPDDWDEPESDESSR